MSKGISDQIRDLENTRAAKAARMQEVAQKAIDEGRSMDEAEVEEFESLDGEVKLIDADLVRMKRLEQLGAQRAAPVEQQRSVAAVSANRGGAPAVIVNREAEEKFQGQNYTRMVIARTLAQVERDNVGADARSVIEIAQQRWGRTNPKLVEVMRAAVAGHGSGSGEAGAELVAADNRFTGDFIEYLYGQTVYDKLGLREVPANVTIKGQDGAAGAGWVGESKPAAVTKADFNSVSLTPLKVASIAVASMELLRDSSPAAEMMIRDSLVNAAAQKIDTTFVSTTAASAGVSPAGILNGVSAFSSSGTDSDGLRQDVYKLRNVFISANNSGGLVFLMNPSMADAISLMVNALGQTEFQGLTDEGGRLLNSAVVTGKNVSATQLICVKPTDIWRIGSMGVEVALSREATIEMADNPTGASDTPVAQTNYPVSMFQTASVALRVIVPINFQKRRSHAAQYITGASYGAWVSP